MGISQYVRWTIATLLVMVHAPGAGAQQDPVQFRSGVEVTSVDVSAIDGRGRAIEDLGPGDFTVTIDGDPRRVVSAEWVSLTVPPGGPALAAPEGYTTNEHATGGRLIILAVDQPNIRFGGTVGIRPAVQRFLDTLLPSDRVAAFGLGPGSQSTPFTANRTAVMDAISRMVGQQPSPMSDRYTVEVSEAVEVRRGQPGVMERVIMRECSSAAPGPELEQCVIAVQFEIERAGMDIVADAEASIGTLRNLLRALRAIDAPKTLVLISEGLILVEPDATMSEVSQLAAESRTTIHVLQIDDPVTDITRKRASLTRSEDRFERRQGLEALAAASRGWVFDVTASADGALERIAGELTGYYLIGVESEPSDKDGRAHPLRVRVNRRNVTVRARKDLVATPQQDAPAGPAAALAAALSSPLPISALPLRAATFSLRAPDGEIQVLIHAEVGTNYTAPHPLALAYIIVDASGRTVDTQYASGRLSPAMNGVPSALQFTGSAKLPPGEYVMKLAVADGDRIGTVEHPVHAALADAAPLLLADLMVGGPTSATPRLAPTVGHSVTFGTLHAYTEAYGTGAANVSVDYEVAASKDGPALLQRRAEGVTAGDQRSIFSTMIPVRELPPGEYVLRSIVAAAGRPVKTMTRDFEVKRPAVLMTSAETADPAPPVREIFLPVGDEHFVRPFRKGDAARADVLDAFKQRVAPAAAPAFERGVSALQSGDYGRAETLLKGAIQPDTDSTPAFVYLAAVFAATGHDREAAGAWQTALIDGAEFPQIYEWLGDALIRTRELAQARSILEEAIAKWPADVRFAEPLALLYATFGQGREAVRTLIRYLDAHPDDRDALALGVQWIYQLHANGATARSRAEDVALAEKYAAAYERAGGPQLALVKQWLGSLARP